MKRILILGATGRTGRLAMDYALRHGYEVNALARDPARITNRSENLKVYEGTPEEMTYVMQAIDGCDAVVSTLNNNRTSDWPWAKQVSPPFFMTRCIKNCVEAMGPLGIKRIVVLSAAGANDSFPSSPLALRLLIRKTNLANVYEDHETSEMVLRDSGLHWTAVRAVGLSNSRSNKAVVESYNNVPRPSMMISRQMVAEYMINSLQDPSMVGKTPVISAR